MKFTIDYFVEKFKAVPDNLWTISGCVDSQGRKDCLGHCGCRTDLITEEGDALIDILSNYDPDPFRSVFLCAMINDGEGFAAKYGNTPKERVLSRLKELSLALINVPFCLYK